MAIEKPEYRVIQEYDDFEIREYEPYLVAEVEIENEFEDAGSEAFGILFDYISGNNIKQEKISMTAPVNQSRAGGEKIAMTAPVAQQESETGQYHVSFVVPAKFTLKTVPKPADKRINIRRLSGQTMAVHKYRGNWSRERYNKNEQILIKQLDKKNIEISGKPVFARYNPPFWPAFMRRNEILIPVNYSK